MILRKGTGIHKKVGPDFLAKPFATLKKKRSGNTVNAEQIA